MRKNREIKAIFAVMAVFFAGFLAVPMISVLVKSFTGNGEAASLSHYVEVLTGRGFLRALGNSFAISICSALLATVLAFILAYTIHYTNVGKRYKWLISKAAILPMLLPTITYGFAIIYSFGKQGLLTQLFGRQLFDIYGFNGLLLGYVVYTLPIAFTLINNAMGYIDKRFMIVSRLMGDSPLQTFRMTIVIPLLGTLATSFIQTFFLCFTDFGIPASVGGQYEVVASVLYEEMLGSIPNFGNGAVVALVMIIPSVVSITVLHILEKYNVRYNKISPIELKKGVKRDIVFAVLSGAVLICALSMFIVMFVTPFIEEWPYRMNFTLEHVQAVFEDRQLYGVYVNSVIVALITALAGTLIAYGGALVTARSTVSGKLKKVIDSIALVTNTIPGMVIGLAYLFVFTGTPLQNTFPIIIICNVVHYFSTPYLMMKNSLSKMNASWETTAMLMGDNWMKTIARVVTPNALSTLLEVFSYYFVNAMVTVSAVIFIAGARTMVITTKIQELQYFNEFNEIFVLSLLILFTNLIARAVFRRLAKMSESRQKTAKIYRFAEKKKAA
ncbi:MAG TPA: ABC transporter permease subunit [Candidatus Mediterraneibacter surreyensis]|nr:ABC transporter permease subunit [Candidatus Mediterraneibacter surreyensis]